MKNRFIKNIKTGINSFIFLLCLNTLSAQQTNISTVLYDGIIVAGYVDDGAFVNFTGPSLKFQKDKSSIMFGMLPSLRFKEDKGITKNSFIFPSLGLGITYSYKYLALQVPIFYNPKTSVDNGKWHLGVGIGLKLNYFTKNK